jgi:hypothetical protein
MNFENFDKSIDNYDDDDYGHFCNLENNYINDYHQKVYFYNAHAILTNDDKPSLYSIDYYYYPDVPDDKYVKIKTFKYELEKKETKSDEKEENPETKPEENKYKKYMVKLTKVCIEIAMFSIFASAVYIIMKTH